MKLTLAVLSCGAAYIAVQYDFTFFSLDKTLAYDHIKKATCGGAVCFEKIINLKYLQF